MNINKVVLSGNLVKDMEVITYEGGALGKFTIANNVGYGDNQKTNYINCTMFGEKRVEGLEKYLVKGTGVTIVGELEVKALQYGEDDYTVFTSILVDEIEITKFKEVEEQTKKSKSKNRYSKK